MIEFIVGVATGILLPFIYGSFLWWRESRKIDSKEDHAE